ncbi:prenyltransferase/squalene oxidase repeat-containing protein [Streptomyces griseoluteus]|uniref:prenyltransferase/squalene oxidase repeat-containing protein n=1 Tax=Streptomyces griseoluteus TaxID=29306 RepID=UPI00342C4363
MLITAEALLDRIDRMCPQDGAVASARGNPPDPMSTAQILVLAQDLPPVRELLEDRIDAAISFLQEQQQQDGRWVREGDDWHTSISAWAVLGLSLFEASSAQSIAAGAAWLTERQIPDGGFSQSDVVREPNTYSTSCAVAALSMTDDAAGPVSDGLGWLARCQDSAGGFGDSYSVTSGSDPSLTAYVAHALSRLPSDTTTPLIDRCAAFIAASQRPSGAWQAWYEDTDSTEGTAASLRVLLRSPDKYAHQIQSGFEFLHKTVDLDTLENWIVVSLAYPFLGDTVGKLAG